tara:strand:- start:883 stop:1209 length:327 start_codon:yes stop_codon:yes gene_type:complete
MNFYYKTGEELTKFMLSESLSADELDNMILDQDAVEVTDNDNNFVFSLHVSFEDDASFMLRFLKTGCAEVAIGLESVYDVCLPIAVLSHPDDPREYILKGKLKLIEDD